MFPKDLTRYDRDVSYASIFDGLDQRSPSSRSTSSSDDMDLNEPTCVNDELHMTRPDAEEPNAQSPQQSELCFPENVQTAVETTKNTFVFRYLVEDAIEDTDDVLSSFPTAGTCGQSSVRVYVDYRDKKGEIHTIAGSGLLVCRSVLTAHHVVATRQELVVEKSADGKEERKELCQRVGITVWPHFYRPVNQLKAAGYPARFDDDLHATINPDAARDQTGTAELDFDLAVIHTGLNPVLKRSLESKSYPQLSLSPTGDKRLLIGYPGQPSWNSIIGASPSDEKEKNLLAKQAEKFMHYHDTGRVASVGKHCKSSDTKGRLSGHRCNSVKGISGGFMIDEKGNFVGTHVKFAKDRNWYYSSGTEINKEAFGIIFESLKNGSTPPPTPPSSTPSPMTTTPSPSPPLMDS